MKWYSVKGEVISCTEKLKVLEQNLEELLLLNLPFESIKQTQEFLDALGDAILFGISKEHFEKNVTKFLECLEKW